MSKILVQKLNLENGDVFSGSSTSIIDEGFTIIQNELNSRNELTDAQIAIINSVSNKQNKTDANLNTTSKEVIGAINELKTQQVTFSNQLALKPDATDVASSSVLNLHMSSVNGHNTKLEDIINMAISSPIDGQVPTYDGATGKWVNKTQTNSTINVNDLPNIPSTKITGLGTVATLNTGINANNIPLLDTNGKLNSSVIPSMAITEIFEVGSQLEMLSLSHAEIGDVAIRTDENKSYILKANDPSVLSNWVWLRTPTDSYSASQIDTLLNGKANTVHNHTISDVTNLQSTLDNKANTSDLVNYATTTQLGTKVNSADIYNKTETDNLLINKSNVGHAHTIVNIDGLQTALDNKVDSSTVSTLNENLTALQGTVNTINSSLTTLSTWKTFNL